MAKKLTKKATKILNKVTKSKTSTARGRTITVKNAEGDPDTTATILIQNKIDYTPRVSVIIPVYNVEKYLRECLDSVVNQTLREIEIICVDDGSTDSSLEILKEYAKRDPRITVITQKNLHAGVARNAGLSIARGEYLSFLDSDDFFELNMLEQLYNTAETKKCDIVVFNYDLFDDKAKKHIAHEKYDNKYIKNSPFAPQQYADELFFIAPPNPWTKLFKHELIEKNNIKFENCISCNDITFVDTALSCSNKIVVTNDVFAHYRINSDTQISKNRELHAMCILHAFEKLHNNLVKLNLYDKYKNVYARQALIRFYGEIKNAPKNIKDKFIPVVESNFPEIYDELMEKLRPAVSVIIPVYNTEKYLHECLDSLVNQTLYNIEIICVNDGSTDNSPKILQEYAEKDNRIKIINNKKNSGAPGPVKNIGIKQATGLYIGFVDADDWVDSDYFAELYSIAIKNNADMASALKITRFDSKREWTGTYDVNNLHILTNINEKKPLIKMGGSNCLKIIKNDFIRKNKLQCWEKRCIAEDNYLSMISMLLANKIAVTDKVAYHYRKSVAESITGHTRTDADFNVFDVYMAIDEYITKLNISRTEKTNMLFALNARKTQDFIWFKNDIDKKYMDAFKTKLQKTFPQVYFNVFNKAELIISLTSYPARIGTVNHTIESLLNQTKKANNVILWLAPEQFPNREKDLPKQLLDLCDKGLTIDWYHDIRSYKKLIPTLRKYPNAIIVTADDDNIYQPTWLEKLYNSYKKHPHDIQAHRVTKFYHDNYGWHVISGGHDYWHGANYLNKLVGLGGVLYPPHCFYKDILNEDLIKQLAPTNDDQWFWLMGAMNGYPVRVVENPEIDAHYIPGSQETALCKVNDNGQKLFWKDFQRLMKYYPKAKEILTKESKKYTVKKDFVAPYKKELEQWYTKRFGPLNLDDPKTFNEKIQWSKIYDSTPIKTKLADKYLVRDWVAEKIGEKYLIPLLGVYDSFDEIDFDKLPNQFVIKCNHGCAYNIIVKNKSELDLADVKAKLDKWMHENFALKFGVELHYRDIEPKIVIEKFIENKKSGGDLYDYKFWCFDGKVYYIQFLSERNLDGLKMAFYDKKWNKQHFVYSYPLDQKNIDKPSNLDEMIKLAEKLSKGFNHVRVDFYRLDDGTIYFGEMTFTSASGTCKWNDDKINRYFGKLFKLPKMAYNIDTGEYYKLPRIKKHINIKPYLLFPYYLLANMWMMWIYIPVLKFTKHTRAIWYSHSHRGKMDMLNDNFKKIMTTVQSVQNNMQKQIDSVKNQQNDLAKQLNNVANNQKTLEQASNDTNAAIDAIRNELKSGNDNVSQQIINVDAKLSETQTHFTKGIENMIIDVQTNIQAMKKHTETLFKQNTELYWANVYHDTINNSSWLANKSISPGRWAISYIVLYVLYRILDEIKPQSILECGLGQSSKLTIQYAESHNAKLMICENNPEWLSFFQRQFPTADKYTKILDTAMVHIVPEYESRTYAGFKSAIKGKKFNLVLIDGPLGSKHYSRPEILDIVNNLDKSFVIMLDDMNRIGEQEIWGLLKQKLTERKIAFKDKVYSSDKSVGVLCSPNLEYLLSL